MPVTIKMETKITAVRELQHWLRTTLDQECRRKAFIGFDGFIDSIKVPVRQKRGALTTYFQSIKEFADRIAAASGKSGQIELETQRTKLGGNAPILANTLGMMGIESFYLGSAGSPDVHPVFADMNNRVKVISALNPGFSDALEFADGKIILSDLEVFNRYNWKYVRDTVGIDWITNAVSESDLIAFVDWVNMPHTSDIWRGMFHEVIVPARRKNFIFLFDLCDPSKKAAAEIIDVLDLISGFSDNGRVILGLNENETIKIWAALQGVDASQLTGNDVPEVREAGRAIYRRMNIESLLIHPIDRTIVIERDGMVERQGRLVRKPKVLTGGGDNLNAGFCMGLLNDLRTEQCMLLGMAASGAYIENGASPDREDLIAYVGTWIKDIEALTATSGLLDTSS